MPVTISDIKWGAYGGYEGPMFFGKYPFTLPDEPTEVDRRLAVLAATEGNSDAINMYDRCIISVGQIQWCEAGMFGVTRLLGRVCDDCGTDTVLVPLKTALEKSRATFKKTPSGLWKFFLGDSEVKTVEQQKQLFLGCDGKKGSWDSAATAHAKLWAASVANIWDSKQARESQSKYTGERLMSFIMTDARTLLFDDEPDVGWVGATRAAFISFAANLPAVANKVATTSMLPGSKWSPTWCIALLRHLTFDPGVTIYPVRYNHIRSVLEKNWGIELPKDASALKMWEPPVADDSPIPDIVREPLVIISPDIPSRDLTVVDPMATEQINNRRMTFFDAIINFIKFIVSLISRSKQ